MIKPSSYQFKLKQSAHWHQLIELNVASNQHVAIVGASGAGKSTLLQLLYLQLRQQFSHSIQQQVAYIPQQLGLIDNLSSYHNVYAGALSRHHWLYNLVNLVKPFSTPKQQILQILNLLGVEKKIHQHTTKLSGGEKQRIAIARAMFQQAHIVLADEALTGLDKQRQQQILQQMFSTWTSGIWVWHDLELALQYCQRIWVVSQGRIVKDITSAEINQSQLLQLCV